MKNMDIFKKTMPYVWMRFFLYLLLGIGIVAYYILAFLIIGLTQGFSILSLIILAIGFSIYFAATRYINYLVKAGHVAVISELAEKGTLPAGVSDKKYVPAGNPSKVLLAYLYPSLVNTKSSFLGSTPTALIVLPLSKALATLSFPNFKLKPAELYKAFKSVLGTSASATS